MNKTILQIFIVLALVQFSLSAQNDLHINSGVSGNYDEIRELNINVSDSRRELFSFKKELLPHQSIPQIELLSNNYVLLIHSLEGKVELYNAEGINISEREFYNLPPYNEQRILFDINKSGFALLVSEAQKNKIYLVNNNGEINYTFDAQDGLVRGLALNNNIDLLAYSVFNFNENEFNGRTIILNTKNNFELNFPQQFEYGVFSDKDKMFLGFTNKIAFIYDLYDQKSLWVEKLENNELFIDGNILNDKIFLIQSGKPDLINKEWVYQGIEVIQKDEKGYGKVLFSTKQSVRKVGFQNFVDKLVLHFDEETIEFKID